MKVPSSPKCILLFCDPTTSSNGTIIIYISGSKTCASAWINWQQKSSQFWAQTFMEFSSVILSKRNMNFTKERQEIKLSILSYVHSETQPYFILTISHCNYSTCFLLSPFFPFLENVLTFFNKMSEVMWYILP